MVDGLSSMDTLQKTDIWLMRPVPHISVKLRENNVENTSSASQSVESRRATSSVVLMDSRVRRK